MSEYQVANRGPSSALRDFNVQAGVTRRHMLRITPQGERPYFDPSTVGKAEPAGQKVSRPEETTK